MMISTSFCTDTAACFSFHIWMMTYDNKNKRGLQKPLFAIKSMIFTV